MKQITISDYLKAFDVWSKSKEAIRIRAYLTRNSIKTPYIDNILRTAFDAGWSAMGKTVTERL